MDGRSSTRKTRRSQPARPLPHINGSRIMLRNVINYLIKPNGVCMTDDLLKYRSEFPILEKAVYLISHSLGAMPRATYDRLHEYADIWASRGVRAWAEGWWDMPVTIGNEVARIIGADPNTVVMHQNVSICQSLILSALLPLAGRSKAKQDRL